MAERIPRVQITVHVTPSDIERGEKGITWACPIAIALRRHVAEDVWIEVKDSGAWFKPARGKRYAVKMPREAGLFVRRFDNRYPVEPFTLELNVPEAVLPRDDEDLDVIPVAPGQLILGLEEWMVGQIDPPRVTEGALLGQRPGAAVSSEDRESSSGTMTARRPVGSAPTVPEPLAAAPSGAGGTDG